MNIFETSSAVQPEITPLTRPRVVLSDGSSLTHTVVLTQGAAESWQLDWLWIVEDVSPVIKEASSVETAGETQNLTSAELVWLKGGG